MSMGAVARIKTVLALDAAAPAIAFHDQWVTWGDLAHAVSEMARLLDASKLEGGAPIGIVMHNHPAIFGAALAVMCAGRSVVTINPMLPPDKLAEDVLELRLPGVVALPGDWASPHMAAVQESGALILEAAGIAGFSIQVRKPAALNPGTAYRAAMPGIAVEMLTSGTTGKPKRIKLPLQGLEKSLVSALSYETRGGEDAALRPGVGIIWSPLSHISGFWTTVFSIFSGRAFALMERFDVTAWHDLVVRHRPKLVSMPPTALRLVLEANFPKEDFSSLLAIRGGAAPLDPDLADAFCAKYGVPFLNAYGATEFAGAVAGWTLKDYKTHWTEKRRSVGRAQPGVTLRVADPETFAEIPVGATGLLEVKTAQVGDASRWVRTNDLARLDADGFLYIVGRADNAIIRGGFKIFPDDVVAALKTYPGIGDAVVLGIADPRLGQVPVAVFEMRAQSPPPAAQVLKDHLRAHLKAYEIPVAFRHEERLPRTSAMKIDSVAVRRLFGVS